MGQRIPRQNKANRIYIYAQKTIATTTKERNRKEQEDEWQTHELYTTAKEVLKAWYAEMAGIRLDKGTDVGDLIEILNIFQGVMFDQNEIETLIVNMKDESKPI